MSFQGGKKKNFKKFEIALVLMSHLKLKTYKWLIRDQLHRKVQLSRDINDWHAYKDARKTVKITLENTEKLCT